MIYSIKNNTNIILSVIDVQNTLLCKKMIIQTFRKIYIKY